MTRWLLLLCFFCVTQLPSLGLTQGLPDIYFGGLFVPDRRNDNQTLAISPNTLNLLWVEAVDSNDPGCLGWTTSCNRLTIVSAVPQFTRIVYVPKPFGRKFDIADDGMKIAITDGTNSYSGGMVYSNDGGQTFQFFANQGTTGYPLLGCGASGAVTTGVFGMDNKFYADYLVRRSLNLPDNYCVLRRMVIDTSGTATHSDMATISPLNTSNGVRWLQMTRTATHIITAVGGFPGYGNTSQGICRGVPGIVETPISTGVPVLKYVGAPCPTYGGPANYVNYGGYPAGGVGSTYTFRITSDGANVYIANPVPPSGGLTTDWKIWKFPYQNGTYFPNTAGAGTPAITDLSQLTNGTDLAAYMTKTQATFTEGQLRGIIAPWDMGAGDRLRVFYATPDQLSQLSNYQSMQFVDLVGVNGGAYSAIPTFAEDIYKQIFLQIFPGGTYVLTNDPNGRWYNFGQTGGLLYSSFGVRVTIPGFPSPLVIHTTDLG